MLMPKKIKLFLILFLLVDLALSFNQYYNTPIDGDLTSIVLPSSKYRNVLQDPIGVEAVSKNSGHGEANRFFTVASAHEYFRTMPFLFQKVMSPISSIYFSAAVFKLITQILIIFLLSAIVSGNFKLTDDRFVLSAALFTIFFQTGGYASTMGIVDNSISYAISYAWPISLLLILLSPILMKVRHHSEMKLNLFSTILLSLLAVLLPFSGSIVYFVSFTIIILTIVYRYILKEQESVNFKLLFSDKKIKFILSIFIVACLYSFFLSFYNSERNLSDVSLLERYKKLPIGLVNIFFGKPGLWILMILTFCNSFVLRMFKSNDSQKFVSILKWTFLFIIVYVLLLPIDGYYDFRPNVIRRDNFLPCTILMVFLFVQSAIYLVKHFKGFDGSNKVLSGYILLVMALYTIADSPSLRKDNCERASLEMLSLAHNDKIELSDQCTIASWYILHDYKDSETNADVFRFWNITKKPVQYIQY